MKQVPLEQLASIVQGGRKGLSGLHFVPEAEGVPAYGAGGMNGYLPEVEFDSDAVVLSAIGARCGKCFLATGKWASLANTQVILPYPDKADARFLWYQLNDETSWPRSGTAQPFIKPSDVKRRLVSVPATLEEQHRIADILDRADAIRYKRREALKLVDELVRATFLEMFGDPVANPKGWPTLDFDSAVTDSTAGCAKLQASDYLRTGRFPVIDQGAGKRGGFTDDEALLARVALPVVLFGDHTKRLKYVAEPFCLGADGVKVLTSKALLPPFLFEVLKLFPLPDVGYSRHFKFFKEYRIPIPPTAHQEAFARRRTAIERVRRRLEGAVDEAEQLFASLQALAFSGEL